MPPSITKLAPVTKPELFVQQPAHKFGDVFRRDATGRTLLVILAPQPGIVLGFDPAGIEARRF